MNTGMSFLPGLQESLAVPSVVQAPAKDDCELPYMNPMVRELARIVRAQKTGFALDGNITWVVFRGGISTSIPCPDEMKIQHVPQTWVKGDAFNSGEGLYDLDQIFVATSEAMRVMRRSLTPLPQILSRRQGKIWVLFEDLTKPK